jgi:hypothetical protein
MELHLHFYLRLQHVPFVAGISVTFLLSRRGILPNYNPKEPTEGLSHYQKNNLLHQPHAAQLFLQREWLLS